MQKITLRDNLIPLSIVFHPKLRKLIIAGGSGNTITVWNRSKKKIVRKLVGHRW